MSDTEKRWAYCAKCGGDRECNIRAKWNESGGDEDVSWKVDWYILQCGGCKYAFVQTVSTNSEEYQDYYDTRTHELGVQYKEALAYWPALAKRKKPDWLATGQLLPGKSQLDDQLEEVYRALDNDLNGLAAIGARTCFDVSAQLLGAHPEAGFESKLQVLVDKGHIGLRDKERLSAMIDAGSATVHRGWIPSTEDLEYLVDILEHFVEHAFIKPESQKELDVKAAKIKHKVPPRLKKGDP